MMKVSDFDFDLPDELIARYPAQERTSSRLLLLDGESGGLSDCAFLDIKSLLRAGDLLVFNNTKVIPARLFGHKETGGKLEILFERRIDDRCFLAHVRSSKSPKPGSRILLEDGTALSMLERVGALFKLQLPEGRELFELLDAQGLVPLPPYIDRPDERMDGERYQTVYAKHPGSAAAPTAGLHFDQKLLSELKTLGVNTAFVTLHVGAGTFQPVKVDDIKDHVMHSEYIEVNAEVVEAVANAKASGGRVIAVGTTSCRSLEAASQNGALEAFSGDTDIFIYPGYKFKTIDALVTNFHLPQSTLLMLVSALAGKDSVMNAYAHAVNEKYRFFSYGDAMFVTPSCTHKKVNR